MFIFTGGDATLRSVTIVAASARGAIEAKGGALFSYGRGTLTRTAVVGCSATSPLVSEGGGLYVGNGAVLLRHATVFDGNTATVGATIHPAGGTVHYAFPIPAGSWLPNARCRVLRVTCNVESLGDTCRAVQERCAVTADPDVTSMTPATVNATPCEARLVVQPCDWGQWPELLGTQGYTLPAGLPINDAAFPFRCAPGILGSSRPEHQTSATCAGFCPAGYLCARAATLHPARCGAGNYCPTGSIVPTP
jgi:hypothetical protein